MFLFKLALNLLDSASIENVRTAQLASFTVLYGAVFNQKIMALDFSLKLLNEMGSMFQFTYEKCFQDDFDVN